jgi:uncharacterized membrane protein
MKLIRWAVGGCFVAICAIFAISNRNLIELQFWPLPYAVPVQTGLAILLPVFFAFLLGGLWVTFGKTKMWTRARQSEKKVERLETALQAMEDRLEEAEDQLQNPAPSDPAAAMPKPPTLPQLQNH